MGQSRVHHIHGQSSAHSDVLQQGEDMASTTRPLIRTTYTHVQIVLIRDSAQRDTLKVSLEGHGRTTAGLARRA